MDDDEHREIWLFLDELGNLPRNESLAEWLSLGRSKGCRMVIGTQSISQIKDIYGEFGADSLLNLFTTVVAMRCGATGITAEYTAKCFGSQEVERPSFSSGSNNEQVINWHRETIPLVTASALTQLPQASVKGVEGFLLVPGWDAVYRLCWPIPNFKKQAEGHIPAKWLNTNSKSHSASSRRDQIKAKRRTVNDVTSSNL